MRKFTRRAAIAGLIAVPVAYFGARRVGALSADPIGPKECLPPPARAAPEVADGSELSGLIRGGVMNDVSCLNATPIHGRVPVTSVRAIEAAIAYARANQLKIAIAGKRHSMGGQAFLENALVLDMTGFNKITLNEAAKTIIVEAGATWHDIQNRLHPRYAVKAMQSTDIFTVGGSISVNAHGMDHQVGALMRTVKAMRVVMADGTVRKVTPAGDPVLWRLIIGGYGLFGVIAEAEIEIADNVIYETGRRMLDYADFPRFFAEEIEPDDRIGLFYAHLSTAPGQKFLRETLVYTYREVEPPRADLPPLGEIGQVKLRRLMINLSKYGGIFRSAKWFAETRIDPLFEACTVPRSAAMSEGEACLVSRNDPMHDSVPYLMNGLSDETDILHEYFIPRPNLLAFIDRMRDVLTHHNANLLNASIRAVHREDNFLSYAPRDAFSVVLYVNQTADAEGNARMAALTSDLIDLTMKEGGRFFLPYQLHYSAAQLRQSYPEIGDFFAAKRRYDPEGLFTNTLHKKYSPEVISA